MERSFRYCMEIFLVNRNVVPVYIFMRQSCIKQKYENIVVKFVELKV